MAGTEYTLVTFATMSEQHVIGGTDTIMDSSCFLQYPSILNLFLVKLWIYVSTHSRHK